MARRLPRSGNRAASASALPAAPDSYWAAPAEALMDRLATNRDGLSAADAASRLRRFGENQIAAIAARPPRPPG